MSSTQDQAPLVAEDGSSEIVIGSINLENIQGDILYVWSSFQVYADKDVARFRHGLSKLLPHITSAAAVKLARDEIAQHKRRGQKTLLECAFTNIAFSAKGLSKLHIDDDIKDDVFAKGQLADAQGLGDPGHTFGQEFEPSWIFPFKHDIHGVLLVAGATNQCVRAQLDTALTILQGSIREVYEIFGHVRPGKEDGHEHFGFEDGISQPAVKGVNTGEPGDDEVDPGQVYRPAEAYEANHFSVILVGKKGDPETGRPKWAIDGSFLAFRLLNQLVPEFNKFLIENAIDTRDPTVPGTEFLGARLVGRWKSGAPIQLTPFHDDTALAADKKKRNDFDFDLKSQEKCPFAAHIRKTYPRNDLDEDTEDAPHRIIRRGIPFGREVTPSEEAYFRTEHDRGLLFVSYQSSLKNGFQFIQKTWVNNPHFPPKAPVVPGFDPLIGQDPGVSRSINGVDPSDINANLNLGMQQWVIPRGGEYFFSPSTSALKNTFAK